MRIGALKWLTLTWPGLPQLWFAGSASGLAMAVGFAVLLNAGLLTTGHWTELLSPPVQTALWLAVATSWLAAAVLSARWVARLSPPGSTPEPDDLFNQARSEYLQGHWYEAETLLGQLLDQNILDAEARLMLAALYRRTGRATEAKDHLQRLNRMDGGQRWRLEISRQLTRIRQNRTEADEANGDVQAAAGEDSTAVDSPVREAA